MDKSKIRELTLYLIAWTFIGILTAIGLLLLVAVDTRIMLGVGLLFVTSIIVDKICN